MLRLLFVIGLACLAWCLIAGLDWVFGLGLIGGVMGLILGVIGAVFGVLAGVFGVLLGAVGVVLGVGFVLIIPALIVIGVIMLFKAAF